MCFTVLKSNLYYYENIQNKNTQNHYLTKINVPCSKSIVVLIRSLYRIPKFTQNYPIVYKAQSYGIHGLIRAVSALKNSYLVSPNSEQYYFTNLLKLFMFQNITFCNSAKTLLI